MSDKPTEPQEKLRDFILAERDKGNLVFAHIEGYAVVSVEDFVKQPVDGMLYDLNRGEEVSLSFITEKKWVNDFAVALTIRKLVEQRDAALASRSEAVEKKVPCWTTSWPDWYDIHDNVKVVPSSDYDSMKLRYETVKNGWEQECKDGDQLAEALGVPRTEGGWLNVPKMLNRISALKKNAGALGWYEPGEVSSPSAPEESK